MPGVKAIILVGGPEKGTRFRPLSLDVPKPLFPVAGLPLIQHHISSCSAVPGLVEILLLGFLPAQELSQFVRDMAVQYKVAVRYLQEYASLGTAGGLHHFRDQIQAGSPDAFFVLYGDACCDFPLEDMLQFHVSRGVEVATVMTTEATKAQSLNYGCVIEDESSHAILHLVEKPSTYISSIISCGVYIFSPRVFPILQDIFDKKQADVELGVEDKETIWLMQEVLAPLAGTNTTFSFIIKTWWTQIKTAGAAIYANRHYLQLYGQTCPERLSTPKCESFQILGDVYIDPTASIHPTAVIGPNVSIGKNVEVGAGARVKESIILGNATLGKHSLVTFSVVGWNSRVGDWARVEGTPDDPNPDKPFAKMDNNPLFNFEGKLNPSITILGRSVEVKPELILLNSIVLPNKQLAGNHKNEIIL